MSTRTIVQLPQVVGGLLGTEQLELAQPTVVGGQPAWQSVRATTQQIAALAAALSMTTAVAAASPAVGENDNYTVSGEMGPTIGFIDLTPTGISNITGLVAGFDGQVVVITNLGTVNLTLSALNSGSIGANQFRMAADAILTQNNARSFKYSVTLGKWVLL